MAEMLVAAARRTQRFGADFLLICTNTMHKVAPAIELAAQPEKARPWFDKHTAVRAD
jgi:aspartate/glutamate racemase